MSTTPTSLHPNVAPATKLIPIQSFMSQSYLTNWLIEDYLPQDSTVMMFGASSSGKSLITLEMAYCVAQGLDWYSHPVTQGDVIYIAGEGKNGLIKRFKALEIKYGNKPPQNIHISDSSIDLLDKQSVLSIEQEISSACIPKLIIIDTLHRNFSGEENSAKDFAIVMQHCDQLRAISNATIILVHHSGHDSATRARGSSSLKAAMDVEYQIQKKGGNVSMASTKEKDIEPPKPINFSLKPVIIGKDMKKRDVSAPVLVSSKSTPSPSPVGPNEKTVLDALKQLLAQSGTAANDELFDKDGLSILTASNSTKVSKKAIVDECIEVIQVNSSSTDKSKIRDSKRKAINRSLENLHKLGLVAKNDDNYYTIPSPTEEDEPEI